MCSSPCLDNLSTQITVTKARRVVKGLGGRDDEGVGRMKAGRMKAGRMKAGRGEGVGEMKPRRFEGVGRMKAGMQ